MNQKILLAIQIIVILMCTTTCVMDFILFMNDRGVAWIVLAIVNFALVVINMICMEQTFERINWEP